MAYANKYKITMATKSGTISYLYLLEDGYSGDLIEYPAVSLQLQYIPRSDNVFEPIVVSQLDVSIDVTEDIENMPNLTSLDDRKYYAQLFNADTLEWQGWSLSDNVQFNFSTGRKTISFNCIDGLGMLQNIYYPLEDNYSLNDRITCLTYITNCLSQIQFPDFLNIISGISYYSYAMTNRSTSGDAEPLIQTYIKLNTFLDQNNLTTTTTNKKVTVTCLEIISQIVQGFGARIFQAGSKWYIVPINQLAQDSYYYTEYSQYTIVGSGTIDFTGQIQGYSSNTSGLFFVDNGQYKIFRKGYNKIRFNKTIDYSSNYITNYDLKDFTGNDANSWTETNLGTGGSITIKDYPTSALNAYILSLGNYGNFVSPINLPILSQNESAKLSFDCVAIGASVGPVSLAYVKVILTTDSYTFYLGTNNAWNLEFTKNYKGTWNASTNSPSLVNGTGTTNDTYLVSVAGVHTFGSTTYNFNVGDLVVYGTSTWTAKAGYTFVPYTTDNSSNNASIELPVAPYTGTLNIEIGVSQGVAPTGYTRYPFSTQSAVQIQNFVLAFNPNYKSLLTESFISDVEDYVYNADFSIGFNNPKAGYFSFKGFLCDYNGLSLSGWYRYEYPTEIYSSLNELVIKQYSNALNKNLINIDASFMGMDTSDGRLNGALRITATDDDPAQINVSAKKYMIGNSTIDLFNNTIKATLLDINNTNIETTLATRYFTNTLQPITTGYGHLRSTAYFTREAAFAAPLTTFLIYNNTNGAPSVGDRYYSDEDLINGFNGASLWWRVMNDALSYHAYKISSSGYILEIYG